MGRLNECIHLSEHPIRITKPFLGEKEPLSKLKQHKESWRELINRIACFLREFLLAKPISTDKITDNRITKLNYDFPGDRRVFKSPTCLFASLSAARTGGYPSECLASPRTGSGPLDLSPSQSLPIGAAGLCEEAAGRLEKGP